MFRLKNHKGFTLVEMLIALAIVTILSAYAVPTFIGYIESANQTKRMNIARTIYLAAQNQLMEKRINKTLDDFSGNIDSEETAEISAKKVSETVLPDKMTKTEKENIVYISKKQGVSSGKVYELLDDVIQDKTVLNNAILIEYNKSTGFVLSVFYSEEEGLDFNYKEADKSSEDFKTLNKATVSGKRPYLFADERKQGYCGIEDTGMLPPSGNEAVINIRDGSEKDEALFYGKEIYDKEKALKNVLYAEAIIKDSQNEYDLSVVSAKSGEKIKDATVKIIPENLSDSLEYALKSPIGTKKDILFKSEYSNSGKKLEKGYIRVIWILDYVKGDMLSQDTSIGKLYPNITPQDIKVNISGGSINATSMSIQNSHFAYEDNASGNAFISSARHLNNVRYKLDGSFRQIKDIDMNPSENENITNFLPIGTQENPFIGKYIARKEDGAYSIENLKVDLTSILNKGDAGLFGVVGKGGEITGVRLENPNIKAASNVGTLAGKNSGRISLITVENNKTSAEPIIKGSNNVGGVIGLNSGTLNMLEFVDKSNESSSLIEGTEYSVGGIVGQTSDILSNAVVISASKEPLVKSNYPSHLGGIVGESNAKINNAIYLAVAPINGAGINPIVGTFSGTIDKTSVIYLSGEAKRPTPIKSSSNNEYNLEKANFGEPKSTKNIIKEVNFKNWSKVEGSNETNMLSVYPYPYQLTAPYKPPYKDGENNWPVVDEDGGIAEMGYYEFYSDDTWGYSNSKTHPLKTDAQLEKVETDKNVHVINDGYFIEYPKANGEYTFEVKSSDGKDIYLLKSTDWKWNDKLVFKTKNIEPIEYTKDGKTYLRLFLRNDILELASEKKNSGNNSSNNQVTIIAKKGSIEVLNTKINPLFAPTESSNKFDIRSPRHLDNIDKITVNKNQAVKPEFLQRLNLDFETYKRELKLENRKLILDDSTKISTDKAIVEGEFAGIYDGNNKYIRNVTVDGAGIPNLGVDRSNIGLFSEIKGSVKNIALLNSNFKGKHKVGGISGTVAKDGSIENCELSEVIVENTEIGSGNAIGGVVGENNGTLKNIYFNSTYRENGEFATPIKSNKEINAVGGIVGNNKKDAVVKNVYITAKGPLNKSGNVNIIVGAGNEGSSGTIENAYYLNVGEYNKNVSSYQGKAFNADGSLVSDNTKKIGVYLSINEGWEAASIDTTKETSNCKGLVYPYPKIKGMNHYFDWPVLINTLKYFEEYSDGTKGYYFNNGVSITDTLKYDNQDLTVVDEGYLVEVLSKGSYDIKFNSSNTDMISDIESDIFDGKIVIKLKHSQVEKLIKNENITKDGIKPIKIEVFKKGESSSFDILETKGKKTYFNPLFPKQIYYYASGENVNHEKTFEVRSPRHMLNVNDMGEVTTNQEEYDISSDRVEKSKQTKQIYLKGIDTKFPYGNDSGTGVYSGTFKFYWNDWTDYTDNTNYYKTREFNYPRSSNDNVELISKTVNLDSQGNEIITEVIETYDVSYEIHRYTMEGLYGGIAYKVQSYWNLNSEYEYRTNRKKITKIIKKEKFAIDLNLKQTISINFGGADGKQVIGNRQLYKWEAGYKDAKSTISGNVISTLYSNYDAGVYFKDGKYYGNQNNAIPVIGSDGRAKRNRIYNLVMNAGSGAGGTFGTIESGVTVKNIEFVDPQIRMKNGRGGGIVANINYGTIDNVQVYNKEYTRSLFAYDDGNTNTAFLQSGSDSDVNYGSNIGGIAAQLVSKKGDNTTARITNCVVGTNSNNIADIADEQRTLIDARTANCYGYEWATNRIGGIVGFVYGNAEVISSINIAKINAWYNDGASINKPDSPFSVGGIAGSTGIRTIEGQVKESFTGGWVLEDKGNSPGHIIGCYNAGSVKLKNGWVAGITGYPATGSTVISCYNTGRINIELDQYGYLKQVPFLSSRPIRIGGIVGESDGAKVINCYNIGYMSGSISNPKNSAAGSIMALPAYTESKIENCYSLKAVEFPPTGLIGKLWNNAAVNGLNNKDTINSYFSGIFITKNQLRDKSLELVNSSYQTQRYINLNFTVGSIKSYPVFNSSTDSFYIYPQLNSFSYGGVIYKNPHITPWEYIDSKYDAVLNYYEKYSDGTFGYSYLDVFGNIQSSLSNYKVAVEDGYFVETGSAGVKYDVEIEGKLTNSGVISRVLFGNKSGILFDANTINSMNKDGYSRIRLYTSGLGEEDKVNRLIGTNTVRGGFGKDIYFDYRFPKEIKYGLSEDTSFDSSKLKPVAEPYYIRTPRHMLNISAVNSLSEPKEFIQETSIDFSKFNNGSAVTGSIVSGEFKGSYNAQGYSLYNLNLNKASSANVAIFESISEKATVSNLRVVSPIVSGSGNVGVIAGLNKGKIKTVVIEKPSLTLTSNTASQNNMGSICGDNQGDILDIFITDSTNEEAIFNISNSGSGNSVGGVVGKNSKNLIRVLYTTKAPKLDDNYIPITASNTGRLEEVYFLASDNYNKPNNNIGIGKEATEFKTIDIINWYEWSRKEGYPYPYLISIKN